MQYIGKTHNTNLAQDDWHSGEAEEKHAVKMERHRDDWHSGEAEEKHAVKMKVAYTQHKPGTGMTGSGCWPAPQETVFNADIGQWDSTSW